MFFKLILETRQGDYQEEKKYRGKDADRQLFVGRTSGKIFTILPTDDANERKDKENEKDNYEHEKKLIGIIVELYHNIKCGSNCSPGLPAGVL